ncbi:MAG: hypothetical protein B6U88_02045 [Candidatus Aenigmarchaeota archaeon ex4484_56]|nr:MAG: hypothetical protein B6U88_02045 [Candidatus Aenigmarchaeota archaeon ex4484_56]
MNNLIFIKLGGSVITDKSKPQTPNYEVINRLSREISEARKESNLDLIIGHGSGSFGHISAKKYKTSEGFISKESKYGLCVVHNDAAKLNEIVVNSFLEIGEKAISLQPSSFCIARNSSITDVYLEPIKKFIEYGIMPVPYGDVSVDLEKGCCIISTEEILKTIALKLKPEKIIMVGKVDGVYTDDPMKNPSAKKIEEINKDNFSEIKNCLKGSDCVDVTGGMLHKIEQSVELAKMGIDVEIISGSEKGNLKNCLLGENTGTLIRW